MDTGKLTSANQTRRLGESAAPHAARIQSAKNGRGPKITTRKLATCTVPKQETVRELAWATFAVQSRQRHGYFNISDFQSYSNVFVFVLIFYFI